MNFIAENWMLIAIMFLSGFLILYPGAGRRTGGVKSVDTIEAIQLINHHDAIILDVREDREIAEGRIPNARHIPLGQLARRINELEKFKEHAVIVNCRSGSRSSGACGILKKAGFQQVYNLAGGISAWQQNNLPIQKK